jgi:hypothetical protein
MLSLAFLKPLTPFVKFYRMPSIDNSTNQTIFPEKADDMLIGNVKVDFECSIVFSKLFSGHCLITLSNLIVNSPRNPLSSNENRKADLAGKTFTVMSCFLNMSMTFLFICARNLSINNNECSVQIDHLCPFHTSLVGDRPEQRHHSFITINTSNKLSRLDSFMTLTTCCPLSEKKRHYLKSESDETKSWKSFLPSPFLSKV